MEYQLTNKEVFEFFEKNGFIQKDGSKRMVKELMEITGYKKSKVYSWFDNDAPEAKSTMPWDIWLLLNALFNPNAELVKKIRQEYSMGEAYAELIKQPESLLEEHRQVKILKDTLELFKETDLLDIEEKQVEQLARDHFKKISDEFYRHYGIGPKTQNRELYKAIRDTEEALNIKKAIVFDSLQELNKEYKKDKGSTRFIDKLLRLYDEYFEQVEEERFENYYRKITDIKKRFDGKYPKKITETKPEPTPEQEAEAERLKRAGDFSEKKFKRGKHEFVKERFNNTVEYKEAVDYGDDTEEEES